MTVEQKVRTRSFKGLPKRADNQGLLIFLCPSLLGLFYYLKFNFIPIFIPILSISLLSRTA